MNGVHFIGTGGMLRVNMSTSMVILNWKSEPRRLHRWPVWNVRGHRVLKHFKRTMKGTDITERSMRTMETDLISVLVLAVRQTSPVGRTQIN